MNYDPKTQLFNSLTGGTNQYNSIGRYSARAGGASDDNFFKKRFNSIENAVGTTLATPVGFIDSGLENLKTDQRNAKFAKSLDDIYKEAGYNNADEYYNAKDAAEKEIFGKYGFDSDAYWNKHAELWNPAGTNAKEVEALDAGRQDVINRMSQEDADKIRAFDAIQDKLKSQTKANSDEATKAAKDWKDYRTNSYVGQKTNQDRGKFAGSAINTLSTAADIMLPTAGVAFNAVQGGLEGVADELEQNGFENFDAQRAAQNALTGATAGAVVGGLNKGLNTALAKRGGNLLKGGNAITRGINNFNATNPVGKIASTLATGASRGALSGAVGGATGAGLSAAMNNQDVLASALQGAQQGAQQGAIAGGVMAGVNMAPGVKQINQKFGEAGENWKNSGEDFGERWKNTRMEDTWGNRLIDKTIDSANAVKQGFKNVGEGLGTLANRGLEKVSTVIDGTRTDLVNRNAVERLANAIDNGTNKDIKFARISQDLVDDINSTRVAQGFEPLTDRQVKAYINTVNNHLSQRVSEGMTANEVAQIAFNALTSPNATSGAIDLSKGESNIVFAKDDKGRYNQAAIGRADSDGGTSLKTIIPDATNSQIKRILQSKEDVLNSQAGVASPASLSEEPSARATISSRQAIDSIVPQNDQNVNYTEDIQNMRINNGDTPETEVYRTLMGDNGDTTPPANSDLMYGESNLGNRTRRGMLASGLERLGNTLEGAQTNVTRAAAKDLGIESTGKVVENVRKKTGITNLETQAQLAKELTGGSDSLMDNIQRQALSASENGRPYKVDTTGVVNDIESIVDGLADTNMFGSQTAKNRFISNLRRDISSYDSDVLTIANRMKSNAAELRGKGVVSPTPLDSAKAKIYSEVANRLDDLSYKAIPQENVDAMFDATVSEMRGRANQAAQNGNNDISRAYSKLADTLDAEPRTVKAYRSFKKDFVDTSKINELTARADNGAAIQMGRGLGGGLKRFGDTLLQRPVNAALAKIGGAVNNVADRISGDVQTSATPTNATIATPNEIANNPATQIYNMIGRTEGNTQGEQARLANYLTQANQEANARTLESIAVPNAGVGGSSTAMYDSVYGTTNNMNGVASSNPGVIPAPGFNSLEEEQAVYFFPPTGDYWSDMLSMAMRNAKNAEDYSALGSLYEMYQDQIAKLEKENSTETKQEKLTATQQRANAAMNSLERISGMTPDLGYNLSNIPVIGGIATLGGNDYEAEAKSLAQQIGYMVSGANIKDSEAESIGKAYVPQPWDSEQTRQNKLRRAYEIITQYQNGYSEA